MALLKGLTQCVSSIHERTHEQLLKEVLDIQLWRVHQVCFWEGVGVGGGRAGGGLIQAWRVLEVCVRVGVGGWGGGRGWSWRAGAAAAGTFDKMQDGMGRAMRGSLEQ